jgi:putative thiamine transport system permease protein
MARTLRRLRTAAGAAPLTALWGLPLALSLAVLLPVAADGEAWALLLAHPQIRPALGLSLFTGFTSTVLALIATLLIIAGLHGSPPWRALQALAAGGLALPHLAFAIGFGFLIMPSGLLARLFAGGDTPPAWVSVQDPAGIALTLALAIKEIPFLLTAAFAVLARGDQALEGQIRAAAALGHGRGSSFLRVMLPQLMAGLRWPLVIVFVYGATVVDMALVLGPTQPPTSAVVIWQALNDADQATNRMGLAGAILLTLMLAASLGMASLALRAARAALRRFLTGGPSLLAAPSASAALISVTVAVIVVLALLLIAVLSVSPRWPYPHLLPPAMAGTAWETLAASPGPLWLSLWLSALAAVTAIAIAALWFETQPPERDRWIIAAALVALSLPQLAIAGGQYRLFLGAGLTGTLPGLFLAHLLPVTAYVMIVLAGPWRAFDGRYVKAARALSAPPLRAFAAIKLPLLKGPVLTALAIGFAVAIVQFVPAQLMAAGRFSTLPMEAVTLSSGGDRALTAAFALALSLPPLLALLLAAGLGRPRWG